jgi:hypothetical protein
MTADGVHNPTIRTHPSSVPASEGVVSFGLGLRRTTGFRVFRLTGPARIVVDVAH